MVDLKFNKKIMDTFHLNISDKCIVKNCNEPICYWSEEYDIGLCSKCYNGIMDELRLL